MCIIYAKIINEYYILQQSKHLGRRHKVSKNYSFTTHTHACTKTDRQTNIDVYTRMHNNRQTDRQTDGQTDIDVQTTNTHTKQYTMYLISKGMYVYITQLKDRYALIYFKYNNYKCICFKYKQKYKYYIVKYKI